MRAATLGALTLVLAAASLGLAQPLPTPAVPNSPTLMERFVTWVKTPPKAAIPRSQREGEKQELPVPGEFGAPALTDSHPVTPSVAGDAATVPDQPPTGAAAPMSAAADAARSTSAAPASPTRLGSWLRSAKQSITPEPANIRTAAEIPTPPTPAPGDIEPTAAATPAPSAPLPLRASAPAPPPVPILGGEVEQAPPPAQLPPPTVLQPEGPQPAPVPEIGGLEPTLGFNDAVFVYDSPGPYWTSVEYLMWRTQHAPLAYPLVTSTLISTGTGAVGSTGAVNFFDKTSMSYPWYSGVRLTAGLWLDSAERTGLEASGFFVNTPGIHFKALASTTQPGFPGPGGSLTPIAIYEPFINATSGSPSAQVIGAQTLSTGFINIDSSSNLNGAELNLVRNVYRGPGCRVELLGGYRYLNLKETLDITSDTNATGTTTALTSPNQFVIIDNFGTRNQFNGAQVGARVGWQRDCFRCSILGKMAFGVTQEYGSINGATTFISSNNAPVTTAGGIYAQPSNSGSFARQQFAVAPQFGLTLGYQAGKHCYFYFGYDFLYWSRVARPGDMINPVINPATIPSNPSFSSGTTSFNPAPLFLSRDFWAQGVDMGLEVKY